MDRAPRAPRTPVLNRFASAATVSHEPLSPPQDQQERLDRIGLTFLAEFLETARRARPDDADVLAELGHVYTRQGRNAEGLEVDRRLARLVPDNPTVHYNLACSLALTGSPVSALEALEEAVRLGYTDGGYLLEDSDLASLRADPRFQVLVRKLQESVATEHPPAGPTAGPG